MADSTTEPADGEVPKAVEETTVDAKKPESPTQKDKMTYFRDIPSLMTRPFHFSIFLSHLLKKDMAEYLLFVMDVQKLLRDPYSEVAADIFYNYVVDGAPLLLKIDTSATSHIEKALKSTNTTEGDIRSMFEMARAAVSGILRDALAIFVAKSKDLAPDLDPFLCRAGEVLKPDEKERLFRELGPQLDALYTQWSLDLKNARARALLVGTLDYLNEHLDPEMLSKYKGAQKGNVPQKRSQPGSAGKKIVPPSNHKFVLTNFDKPTDCFICNGTMWGLGYQGVQCAECLLPLHRNPRCWTVPPCPGVQGRGFVMRDKSTKKPVPKSKQKPQDMPPLKEFNGSDEPAQEDGGSRPSTSLPASPDVNAGRRTLQMATIKEALKLGEPTKSSWSESVPKDTLKKLSKHDIKRQETIYELIQTDKNFVADMITLKEVFQDPMREQNIYTGQQTASIFSNLDEVIMVAYRFCKRLLGRQAEAQVVEKIGDLFDDEFELFKVFATFCANTTQATDEISSLKRSKKDFEKFIQEAESNARCHRLALDSFLASPMQRLTRYQLLLKTVADCTPQDHPDKSLIADFAMPRIKDVLDYVNKRTARITNTFKLKKIQASIESNLALDLCDTPRELIHEGSLDVKMAHRADDVASKKSSKLKPVHAIVFSDMLLVGEMKNGKLVVDVEPIPLYNVLVKDVASSGSDKKSFFLISTSNGVARMHELSAYSVAEKKNWIQVIEETSNRARTQHNHGFGSPSLSKRASVRSSKFSSDGGEGSETSSLSESVSEMVQEERVGETPHTQTETENTTPGEASKAQISTANTENDVQSIHFSSVETAVHNAQAEDSNSREENVGISDNSESAGEPPAPSEHAGSATVDEITQNAAENTESTVESTENPGGNRQMTDGGPSTYPETTAGGDGAEVEML
eukprot:comp11651_c1_seq1/m.6165 comp11651_c1_seq1/g.6165  ORF comp11651_c1_seq1/g.6165 comp11651_c1_seq1/m.6165 type:complete len:917 (-) comp11651_c1_seq1:6-2756(-)